MKKTQASSAFTGDEIAIVGTSVRLPNGCNNLNDYWRVLVNGEDLITEVSDERWNTDAYYYPERDIPGKAYTKSAGQLDNIWDFDAAFFNISPREAAQLDPQQRLLLELSWEAFENAGILPSSVRGSDGNVYIGISSIDFGNTKISDLSSGNSFFMLGTTMSIASNRLSYFYDMHGSSMSVDTACSSSLYALDLACQKINSGDSDMAICGGVSILMTPYPFIGFSQANMLSKDGRCMAFDSRGNGYVRSEGGGIMVLKRLSKALEDGNPIHAIVAGVGTNADGRTNGISLPSTDRQEELLRKVYKSAKISPSDVTYLEAHGTGTIVGDAAEVGAIGRFFGPHRTEENKLVIGSAKTNTGHLEAGSGMAGLVKAALVVEKGVIPKSLHIKKQREDIPFDEYRIKIATENVEITDHSTPIVVGINSFGFGGANGHAILKEYKSDDKIAALPLHKSARGGANNLPPLFLSARSDLSLTRLVEKYLDYLGSVTDPEEYSKIATATVHYREQFENRLAVTGTTIEEIKAALTAFLDEASPYHTALTGLAEQDPKPIAFVFNGNGAQYPGMAKDLMVGDPVFREWIEKLDALIQKKAGWSIVEKIEKADQDEINDTTIAQPLIMAVQIALVEYLDSFGIQPAASVGHSVGEIAAAYSAGILTLDQAVDVILKRSNAQGKTRGFGSMAAMEMIPGDAEELLKKMGLNSLVIAGYNGPTSLTLSGPEDDLLTLRDHAKANDILFKKLDLDYPFHSASMDPIEQEIRDELSHINPSNSVSPFISTVTGDILVGEELDADYWWQNIRKPVQFKSGLEKAWEAGCRLFVEIGPKSILQGYIRSTIRQETTENCGVRFLTGENDVARLAEMPGQIFVLGGDLDLNSFLPKGSYPTDLPTYPFDKQTYILDQTPEAREGLTDPWDHPLLGERGQSPLGEWTLHLGAKNPDFLMDHKVAGSIVYPAAGFVEMALAATRALHGDKGQVIENLEIHIPLILEEKSLRTVRFEINAEDGSFIIRSRPYMSDGDGMVNATGRIAGTVLNNAPEDWTVGIDPTGGSSLSKEEFYPYARNLGLDYGPAFQGLNNAQSKDDILVADLTLPNIAQEAASDYVLHPALGDSCLQALFVLLKDQKSLPEGTVFLPSVFGRVSVYQPGVTDIICHARLKRISARSIMADFRLTDKKGALVAELIDCRFRKFENASAAKTPSRYQQLLVPAENSGKTVSLLSLPELKKKCAAASSYASEKQEIFRDEVLPLTEALTSAFAYQAITNLGGDFEKGITVDELLTSAHVAPEQKNFLEYLLVILHEDDQIHETENGWRLNPQAEIYSPSDIWRLLIQDHPETLPEMTLLGRSGLMLEDILQGKVKEENFAYNSGTAIPKFAAEGSHLIDYIEDQTNNAVVQLTHNFPENKRLRILEVDAQSVLGTQALLEKIARDNIDFVFSSTNSNILHRGQQDLAPLNGVSCILLEDISTETVLSLQQQYGQFDIIISRGTPWAPPQFESLSYLSRSLLAQGGKLIVSQTSEGRLTNLIAGGNEAWWDRTPEGQKPVALTLPASAWCKHLEAGKAFKTEILLENTETSYENGGVFVAEHLNQPTPIDDESEEQNERTKKVVTLLVTKSDADKKFASELRKELPNLASLILTVGPETARQDESHFTLSSFEASAFADLGEILTSEGWAVENIIHLAGLFTNQEDNGLLAQQSRCTSLINALQGFAETVLPTKPSLFVVTSASQASENTPPSPLQSPLWGLGRVIANEYPDISCKLIDIDEANASLLGREILTQDREIEVILRGSQKLGTRLRAIDGTSEVEGPVANVGLNFQAPGALENLAWFETEIPELAADEICLEMKATGLNFRDVMWAMGVLKDEAVENGYAGPTLGMEGSGIITGIGSDVDGFEIGDRVMSFASNCFSKFLCTKTTAVAKIPDSMSFEEAATIPSVFFTVYYAFEHLARLQPGERVLIHGAAGGVGLAAIQYARHVGAEIFVTAGSEEKRDFLKLQGIDNILDSRSLAFADQIMELTKGDGIDVVLNSLSGEAIAKNLSILKPFGRFLELGKRDFYADSKMGLRPFRNNITYYGIDADQLLQEKPALSAKLFREMMVLFEEEAFTPLVHSVFQQSQITEAFRTLQQSRHIGKIVVSMAEMPTTNIVPIAKKANDTIRDDGVCVVTGGLGGFGLATAKWLSDYKYSHLALMGRSGVKSDEDQRIIDQMVSSGITVETLKVDVTDAKKLGQALQKIRDDGQNITGVVHCAMVLDDGMISNIEADRLEKVLAPKITGAWNLHTLTLKDPVKMFLLYSSATTYIGNPGQAAYVAGNSYLEALADFRRAKNLPATAIAWGAIADVGVLAANEDVKDILVKRTGLKAMEANAAMLGLKETLEKNDTNCAVLQLNWGSITNGFSAGASARYDDIRHLGDAGDSGDSADDILAQLVGKTDEEANDIVLNVIIQQISAITGSAPERISPKQSLFDLGIDSLMALELTMELERKLGVELSSMSIIGAGNISDLAAKVVGMLLNESNDNDNAPSEIEILASQHGLNMDDDDMADVLDKASRAP